MENEIYCGKKLLRCGISTGSCATAAAKAAALVILGKMPVLVDINLPNGNNISLATFAAPNGGMAVCKDGGDDIDATHGLLICATVTLTQQNTIEIVGGVGIGRVTLSGLEQPIGAYAINSTPQRMITQAVREVLGASQGACVTIYVPGGEKAAKNTANARLGIIGGISILGTSGIVKPMSQEALISSIQLELATSHASGKTTALLTPGNYGETFLHARYGLTDAVLCSNFIGEAIDHVAVLGFRSCLLVGHIGKLVKVAGGIFQTHSQVADARMEILAAHAALSGANCTLIEKIMAQKTTDGVLDLLEVAGLLVSTMISLTMKVEEHLTRRGGDLEVGAVIYCNRRGVLGQTPQVERLLNTLKNDN